MIIDTPVRFGAFHLDPSNRQLTRDDCVLALTSKAIAALIVLLERHPHFVSVTELAARAIPDSNVDHETLRRELSILIDVLGVSEGGTPYIEAHAPHGYRFAGPVLRPSPNPISSHLSGAGFFTVTPLAAAPVDAGPRTGAVKRDMASSRYQIIALLGAGGMGEVYLAYDTQLDRKVALKLLSAAHTDNVEWLQRFTQEARAASALNHPNILTIHEIGLWSGHHYIATEYIEGGTLRTRMREGSIGLASALDIASQVANALSVAHAAGIIHRDIKPENIMLRPDGYVKLLDFGIAKPVSPLEDATVEGQSLPGDMFGTTQYMSPEHTRGLAVDARSDVFSLGVVLFEMLAARAPFGGGSVARVVVSILEREPPPLTQEFPELPPEIDRIVARALAKDRAQRYQTMDALHDDLRALQRDIGSHDLKRPPTGIASDTDSLASPQVHYARSGDINIAYQVLGEGPLDLVFVMGWISHLEYFWTEPSFAKFLRRLATFSRVILFDKRGTGLSDRVPLDQLPTLEQRMDDLRAVMDAVGSACAVLCGVSEGGPMCSLFAATYPEKTVALVMMGSYARRLQGEGYPWGPSVAERDIFLEEIRNHWGGPVGLAERAPSVANDPAFRSWWAGYLRHGASPSAAVALTRMNTEIDIRHVLKTIRVPTLVVHRSGDACLKVEEGRYLADNIANAKFVELPGVDHLPFVGEQDEILDEIESFLTGVQHLSDLNRVLATVLCVRIVHADPNSQIEEIRRRSPMFFKREVALFNGRIIDTPTRVPLLATFDGPARAIRAAVALKASARRVGVLVHTGLHTGECEVTENRVSGHAVEIARQICEESAVDEILVSSTVRDLVSGSGIGFSEGRMHELHGALGAWKLFAVQ